MKKKEITGSSSDEDYDNERAAREIRVKEERERLAAQRGEDERERKGEEGRDATKSSEDKVWWRQRSCQ